MLELYRVTFIGHSRIYGNLHLTDRIERIVSDLIRTKEFVEFYVGRNGDFDIYAASAVKAAQRALGNHNSYLTLVQPYPAKDDEYYEKYYDAIERPISPKIHPKGAITARNRWLIDNADLLIAYVEDGQPGGAMTALNYAKKRNLEILNLATVQDEEEE